ncbi:unnamed protein product [Camellia sinensis]
MVGEMSKGLELETGFKAWLAKQSLPVEAAVVTTTSATQGTAIGAFMGTLTNNVSSSFYTPPPNAASMNPQAMASLQQGQALAGGPFVQAHNFAVMTGVHASISCVMKGIRGKEDVQSRKEQGIGIWNHNPLLSIPKMFTITSPWMFLMFFLVKSFPTNSFASTFTVTNNCPQTIWPGTLVDSRTQQLLTTDFKLDFGQSVRIPAFPGWLGRIWARTGCKFVELGVGTGQIGDCGGRLECDGVGAAPLASLFKITMGTGADEKDFYDALIAALKGVFGVCNATGCVSDLNTGCPKELQVVDGNNGGVGVVGCRSACEAFGLDQYCCSGEFANPTTCRPSSYSPFSRLLVRELIAMHLMIVPALSLARLPIMPSFFAPISLPVVTMRSNGAILIPAPPMIQFQHTINREISDMIMEEKQSTISIFMFPWLAHGHISPYLELAKKPSTRNFKIYLCSTPVNLTSIKRKLSEKYSNSIQLIELHVPPFPDLPPPYHTTKDLPPHLMPTLKKAFDSAEPNFSLLLKAHKPDLLIYDFLQPWAQVVAAEYGIPAVDFITSSATATMTAFMHHLYKDPLITFPFPSIYLRDYDKVEVSHFAQSFEKPRQGQDSLTLIISLVWLGLGKKIVLVPLVQDCVHDNDERGIIGWLKKKELRSTVFVCFGTEYFLSEDGIEEIAYGLEISGVNFVWVVRFPMGANTSVEKAMPRGFILLHPSIGGFVSHCGWSSVMEGMKLGSPIIAIPMHLDQPVNARLVEEIGVGMEAVRDKNGVLDRKNVAEVIQKVVVDDGGEAVRSKVRELSETPGIKGEEDIDGMVEELVRLYSQKKRHE